LLEIEILAGGAAARTKTVLGIVHFRFNNVAALTPRHGHHNVLGMHFSREAKH